MATGVCVEVKGVLIAWFCVTISKIGKFQPNRCLCVAQSVKWLRRIALNTLINIRKIKFIAYIYIHFNQNVDEKSDISAKIEAGKHLHAVFLLTAIQRQ